MKISEEFVQVNSITMAENAGILRGRCLYPRTIDGIQISAAIGVGADISHNK